MTVQIRKFVLTAVATIAFMLFLNHVRYIWAKDIPVYMREVYKYIHSSGDHFEDDYVIDLIDRISEHSPDWFVRGLFNIRLLITEIRSWLLRFLLYHYWQWLNEPDPASKDYLIDKVKKKDNFCEKWLRDFHLRSESLKNIIMESILKCKRIVYLGRTKNVLPDIKCVLHPVDHFVKRLYREMFPKEKEEAFAKYKRTNPTIKLKIKELVKFDDIKPMPPDILLDLEEVSDELISDIKRRPGFDEFCNDLANSLSCTHFDNVEYDGSSAAGYPYRAGVKRRDVIDAVKENCIAMMNNTSSFLEFMREHQWYTAGRAKLQELGKDDASRLVLYAGFSPMMIAFKYSQPFVRFMIKSMSDFSGVGFSWMHEGADKFARYFMANAGYCPDGFSYASVDVSGWDNSVHPAFLHAALKVHRALIDECAIRKNIDCDDYKFRFIEIFKDMINCTVNLPGGFLVSLNGGIKSGWAMTCPENTLIHEFVYRIVCRRLNMRYGRHMLVGDDNFFMVPEKINADMIKEVYLKCGFKCKFVQMSKVLEDLDFLSKFVKYDAVQQKYYPWRPEIESHSRILMPEEFDPSRREVPDPRIAAERILGHLFDNPYNGNVRHVCYTLLHHIKKSYDIDVNDFVVGEETIKRWGWQMRDIKRFAGVIPMIPPVELIEELYGLKMRHLSFDWKRVNGSFLERPTFDWFQASDNSYRYALAQDHTINVSCKQNSTLSRQTRNRIKKFTRFHQLPQGCYGNAGGKLMELVNDVQFSSMLDIGSHPGGAVATLLNYRNDVMIDCVSLYPECDRAEGIEFCPKIPRVKNVTLKEGTVFDVSLAKHYDLVFDDAYSFEEDYTNKRRAMEMFIEHIKDVRARVEFLATRCDTYIFKVRGLNSEIKEHIYEMYKLFGEFDIQKPLFSYPWNPEFYVILRKSKSNLRNRKITFIRALDHFLNEQASRMHLWNDAKAYNAGRASVGKYLERNPAQLDVDSQKVLQRIVFKSEG